jgi:DNA-binding transcriptional LysR family regulator
MVAPMNLDDRVIRRMKLSDLRLLDTVVRNGSMAKAASQLNISQPAVSKAIKALEHTLGVSLLDRSPIGIEPTIYGQALLDGGVAVFDEIRQSLKQIEFLADPSAGELHFGCSEAAAAGLVPAVIERLLQKYPRIMFNVTTADPATLIDSALRDRTIEFAVSAMPEPPLDANIQTEFLFDDHHVVMAGPTSKWLRRRGIRLADLMDEPWLLPPPDSTIGRRIAEAFLAEGLEVPRSRVQSFSIPLFHHLLASGSYLTLHPVVMVRLGNHLPVRMLDVRFEGIRRPVGILTLKNRTLSALALLFMQHLRTTAKPLQSTRRRS